MQAPDIVYAGFLVKQGKLVKNWKNRWFELGTDQRLKYYKQSPGNKPSVAGTELGVINLRFCEKVVRGEYSDLKKWPVKDLNTCFSLVLPHRTYYLRACHSNEAADWRTYIELYRKHDGNLSDKEDAVDVGDTKSESEDEEDAKSDESPDTFSMLSANLLADESVTVHRSRSVIRGRLDTNESKTLSRESEHIAKMNAGMAT